MLTSKISDIKSNISKLMKNDKYLSIIRIYHALINDDLVKKLSFSLCKNNNLVTLSLFSTNIGNRGVFYLSESLKINRSLKTLKLIGNIIGDDGCFHLSFLLSINKSIEELDLLKNNIGNKGVKKIAEGIVYNTTLIHLRLWNNKIGNKGIKYLASSISINETLKELILSENAKIDNTGMKILEKTLKNSNVSLTEVVITNDYERNDIQKEIDEICIWNYIGFIELTAEIINPLPFSVVNRIFFIIWIIKTSTEISKSSYLPTDRWICLIMNMLKVKDVVKSGSPIDFTCWT